MQINFYATFRPIVGGRSVEFDLPADSTVREVVDSVVTRFPPLRKMLLDADGNLYSYVHVFINGRDAQYLEHGIETTISSDDTIDIFPAIAGGSHATSES